MMDKALITNIQRFSLHDGDGIRTTVFFKGCPLACKWCHNPETQSFSREIMFYEERCTGCGACVKGVESCVSGAREIAGTDYSVEDLADILLRDRIFYETSGGGVTLSGGEPLAQNMGYIANLLKRLKRYGISTAIDTCGDVPWENFQSALPYTNVFLYDIKSVNAALHREFTGKDNSRILENLVRLNDANADIYLRIPIIGGFNDNELEIDAIIGFIAQNLRVSRISLLPYHDTGLDKWRRIGKHRDDIFNIPEAGHLQDLAVKFKEKLINSGSPQIYIGG